MLRPAVQSVHMFQTTDNRPPRILLVKTSSLGDLIHSFPALTDAARVLPGLEFHWLVEEAFSEVPRWHPAVSRAIPIGLRRWRGNWRKAWRKGELSDFKRNLQSQEYDLVIDAQGLLKSAIPARLAHGICVGYDRSSIREPMASRLYQRRFGVSRELHAIERIRRLFGAALDYTPPLTDKPDYGLAVKAGRTSSRELVFLHATTWPSKHWPEIYWAELTALAYAAGYTVQFPWHTPEERLRAERIMSMAGSGGLLSRMDLSGLKEYLASVAGAVGVDSGLAHVTAAVNTPAVTLYGPTSAGLTGAVGRAQKNLQVDYECAPCMKKLCAKPVQGKLDPPCFETLPPALVWQALVKQLEALA